MDKITNLNQQKNVALAMIIAFLMSNYSGISQLKASVNDTSSQSENLDNVAVSTKVFYLLEQVMGDNWDKQLRLNKQVIKGKFDSPDTKVEYVVEEKLDNYTGGYKVRLTFTFAQGKSFSPNVCSLSLARVQSRDANSFIEVHFYGADYNNAAYKNVFSEPQADWFEASVNLLFQDNIAEPTPPPNKELPLVPPNNKNGEA